MGVDVFEGICQLISDNEILCNDKILKFNKLVIATGCRPFIPEIFNNINIDTNKTIFNYEQIPKSIIFVGAGPIGIELGQTFNRLGSKV